MKRPENRPWKVLKSEYIAQNGQWLNLRQELVELPNGQQIPTWYIYDFPDWINVIAITKDGHFVMESQYRHGIRQTHYELCAGVVEDGEEPLHAAQRELLEETGYTGGEWTYFMKLSPNPTNHSNYSHTFLAIGVEKTDNAHLEKTEDIDTHLLTRDEVMQLLQEGEIIQALHAAPLWKYMYQSHE
ncbi:MAG: NUDIX hydrolase [Paludibacteraceae bacterium]|nr:NUDIX hydrolase [Paludibacteraceae bacterium]